jgi:predicted ATPase/DNA-binding winged helix-turn-helix (wHTH) protein
LGNIDHHEWLLLDGCVVDPSQCELIRRDDRVHLTTKEVEVLAYFVRNPSRSISYEELLERVWGYSRVTSTQPVYSVVKRLRRKLDGVSEHRHIVTVHGVGYRFEPPRNPQPPPTTRAAPPTDTPAIPARLSKFVGRARELAAVESAFAGGARVVSLVGMGGAGKTRLSVEFAAACTEFHGREVVSCDLSEVSDAAGVRRAVAAASGVRSGETGDVATTAAIARALRSRETWMLLLDNAEHVLDATARIASEIAPHVRILVTSRERLGTSAEHVIAIGPLERDDAVSLFRDRVREATDVLDDVLREIVERLDGLPLAIELAAAQAGVLSLERVRRDLDRQLERLVATRRGGPERHATLRASVEWSWDMLDHDERDVLAQCSVFVGGFTVDALEAVVRCDGPVLSRWMRLCERSLVRRVEESPTETRYALYQCVRELAVERWTNRADVEARHRAWALDLARDAGALEDMPSPRAGARLAEEAGNLLAAFESAREGDPSHVAELALAVATTLEPTSATTAIEVLQRGLQHASGPLAVRIRLALGRRLQHRGVEGERWLEETVSLASSMGTPVQRLEAERMLGACRSALGDPGAALPRLESALRSARETNMPAALVGRIALDLGETHLAAGAVERARELLAEAAHVLEAADDATAAAQAYCAASYVHREQREYEAGLATLERARRLLTRVGDEGILARLALDRGILLATRSHSAEACDGLGEAVQLHRRLGMLTGELRARDWRVLALLGLARDDEALAEAREMQQLGLDLGRPVYEAERAFGAVWLTSGRLGEADAAFGRALDVLAAGGKETVRAHVLSARALGRVLADRFDEAESDLAECLRVHDARGGASARLNTTAMLALVREFIAPREATDAILDAVERDVGDAGGSSSEARQARARRAVISVLRARRAGRPASEIAALNRDARTDVLGGVERAQDYFIRCVLLMLDHAVATNAIGRTYSVGRRQAKPEASRN